VDALGGIGCAVAIAKKMAGIPEDEQVTVMEAGRVNTSPLALIGEHIGMCFKGHEWFKEWQWMQSMFCWKVCLMLLAAGGGASAAVSPVALAQAAALTLLGNGSTSSLSTSDVLSSSLSTMMAAVSQIKSGRVSYLMMDVDAGMLGSLQTSSEASVGGSFLQGEGEESLNAGSLLLELLECVLDQEV
jgi:hypothetical protein